MSNCLFKSSRADRCIPRFFVFTIVLRKNHSGFKIWKKGKRITKKQVKALIIKGKIEMIKVF
ncbi:hypothetical protein Ppb6_04271 [Photorhabdus australis subsp. thailandensis]|uniref:Uncharacterized protein n=1 Tax=Photorhabdus australis subsp. thailandensis TaxID=2805096 RepID=A0A1C0TY11_9GAMM|nr:hypothetical protein Ppb6_04271 [Photorhabdus australis subsp. thailandensis]